MGASRKTAPGEGSPAQISVAEVSAQQDRALELRARRTELRRVFAPEKSVSSRLANGSPAPCICVSRMSLRREGRRAASWCALGLRHRARRAAELGAGKTGVFKKWRTSCPLPRKSAPVRLALVPSAEMSNT